MFVCHEFYVGITLAPPTNLQLKRTLRDGNLSSLTYMRLRLRTGLR